MPDIYDEALTAAGGDPAVIENFGRSDPRIAAHPKFQKLLAGVRVAHSRQIAATQPPGIMDGVATAAGRSLYDAVALAPGLVAEGIYSGQKGLAQGMNTVGAAMQAAPANAPVEQYQGVARGLASGNGVPFDRRTEEARIDQMRLNPVYQDQVAKELEYNREMGHRQQMLEMQNQDVVDQVGEIPSALQGYGEGTQFIQKTGGTVGTYLLPGVGIPLGMSVSAGIRMGDATLAGVGPRQAIGLGSLQAVLDAIPIGRATSLIRGGKGVGRGVAEGAALGVPYAVADSLITQQYDPEAASEQRSLGSLALATGVGAFAGGAVAAPGARQNARLERGHLADQQRQMADIERTNLDEKALSDAAANDVAVENRVGRDDVAQRELDAEVSRDLEAQRELDAEQKFNDPNFKPDPTETAIAEESARNATKDQQVRKFKQTQVDDLHSAKLDQIKEARDQGLPKPAAQDAAKQLRAWRAEQMNSLSVDPAHEIVAPDHVTNVIKLPLEKNLIADRVNAEKNIRENAVIRATPVKEEIAPAYQHETMPDGSPNLDMMASHEQRTSVDVHEPQSATPQMIKPGMKRPALERIGTKGDPSDLLHSNAMRKSKLDFIHNVTKDAPESIQQTGAGFKRNNALQARKGAAINPAEIIAKGAESFSEGGIPRQIHDANVQRKSDLSSKDYTLKKADQRLVSEMRKSNLTPEEVLLTLKDPSATSGPHITKEFRDLTDELSSMARKEGLIHPKTGEIFDDNIGTYTNDSFKAHDPVAGPLWEKQVTTEVKKAYSDELVAKGLSRDEANTRVRLTLQSYKDEHGPFASGGEDATKGVSPGNLKTKQDLTPAYRALLGPQTNPRVVAARTVGKLNKLITDRVYARKIINDGYGEYFFDKATDTKTGEYVHPVTVPSFYGANRTSTYYTSKAIHDYLVSGGARSIPDKIYEGARNVDNYVKASKTIGNLPGFNFSQVLQNSMSMVANGHLPGMPGTVKAVKSVASYLAGPRTLAREAMVKDAISHGVIVPGDSTARILDQVDKGERGRIGYSARTPVELIGALWSGAKKGASVVDASMKLAGWEMQQAWLKKLHPGKSDIQIKRMAAKDVRDTYFTPDETYSGARKMGRIPGLTNFIMPFAEGVRNPYHIVGKGIRDFMKGGVGVKAAVLGKFGALLSVAAAPQALSQMSLASMEKPPDDDEVKAFMKENEGFYKHDDIWFSRDSKGNLKGYNLSKYDIFSWPRHIAKAAIEEGQTTSQKLYDIGKAISAPLISPALRSGWEAIGVSKNPNKDNTDLMKAVVEPLMPSFLGHAYNSMTEEDKDKATKSLMAGFFGVNTLLVDPKEKLKFNIISADNERKSEVSHIAKYAKDSPLTAEQSQTMANIRDERAGLKADAVSRARALGLSEAEVVRVLRNTGESPTEVGKLVLTKEQLSDPAIIRLKSMLSKMDDQHGPELAVVEQIQNMPKGIERAQMLTRYKNEFKSGIARYIKYKIANNLLRTAGRLPQGEARTKLLDRAASALNETPPSK